MTVTLARLLRRHRPQMSRQRTLGSWVCWRHCRFQLFYGDGVKYLGAESATREHVSWVSAI
ncbi:hypothetical protein BGY98DRAFT_1006450 [Russula aff. rugulosa BPL654]|nr:hypothetical protein BGY98DRAFT_1006450 [Russula aff. rugulosa BPL654]